MTNVGKFLLLFGGIWALMALWSYQLVDGNLVLSQNAAFLQFQYGAWEKARDTLWLTWSYSILVGALWLVYASILTMLKRKSHHQVQKRNLLIFGGIVALLILAHNALSHDIFNYLFNARMVLVYGADPHTQTALEFAADPWTRFMHNTHTVAPYGKVWTWLSLPPVFVGMGKFLPSWLLMKGWMALGLSLYLFFLWKLIQKTKTEGSRWWWVALHPLILMETLMNGHNDVWMLWPMLVSYVSLLPVSDKPIAWWKKTLLSFLMIGSIMIKFATFAVLPILSALLFTRQTPQDFKAFGKLGARAKQLIETYWADLSAMALMAPLFTARSQQFHPWYLTWSLTFLPFIRFGWLRAILFGLSVTSMFRYVPWLANALEYTPLVQSNMRLITWSGAGIGLILWLIVSKVFKKEV